MRGPGRAQHISRNLPQRKSQADDLLGLNEVDPHTGNKERSSMRANKTTKDKKQPGNNKLSKDRDRQDTGPKAASPEAKRGPTRNKLRTRKYAQE